jgi:hypothetical protein
MAGTTPNEAWIAKLVTQVPSLRRLHDEHVADNDELLPHVFMGDVTRFVESAVAAGPHRIQMVREILAVLEQAAASAEPSVLELVSVSFLENLDRSAEGYEQLRSMMGPALREELALYEEY